MPIVWDFGPAASTNSQEFRAEYRAALDGPMANAVTRGDPGAAFGDAAKIVEAVYETPHLAHAPMEPLNATAHWRPDRLDVWMGTQAADSALQLAASAGGIEARNVYVHNCFLGGGFGRRAVNDELRQAVEVAKAVGKPVKLIWTREEDIRHDRYRPQAALRLKAALGRDGMPKGFDFRTAVGSITRSLGWGAVPGGVEPAAVEGLSNVPYRVDALKVDCLLKNTHVPVMFWRSVGSSQNAFAVESFIDEVAHEAGKDAYQFRRALLADRPDFLAVLDKLAEKGEWGRKMPAGSAQGLAIHESFGTIVGEIVEVAVRSNGEVKVERVVACVDCGHVVNPLTVEMQIESAVLYGLTAALFGEITIKDGRVEQGNFNDYEIARNVGRAGHRNPFRALGRRQVGRHRRARHAADRARRRQRDLRRHGQAHPFVAAEECEPGGLGPAAIWRNWFAAAVRDPLAPPLRGEGLAAGRREPAGRQASRRPLASPAPFVLSRRSIAGGGRRVANENRHHRHRQDRAGSAPAGDREERRFRTRRRRQPARARRRGRSELQDAAPNSTPPFPMSTRWRSARRRMCATPSRARRWRRAST